MSNNIKFKKASDQSPLPFVFKDESYMTPDQVWEYYVKYTYFNRNWSDADLNEFFNDEEPEDEALVSKVLKNGLKKCRERKAKLQLKKIYKGIAFNQDNINKLKQKNVNLTIKK